MSFYSTKDTCTEVWGDGKRFNSLSSYCDDGNTSNGDGWSSSWDVESGRNWSGGSTTSKDTWSEIWGDGKRYNSISTYWDDGNLANGDGWSSVWAKEIGWSCSGGTTTSKDVWSEIWGDGKRYNSISTYWDDGNLANGDGWSSSWGVESGWSWVGGTSTTADAWNDIWGDSKVVKPATNYWDDGNLVNNDGCNSSWNIENGWTWSSGSISLPSSCSEICGDGIRFNSIATYWDDGNLVNGDGCSSLCNVEAGYGWTGGNITTKDIWSTSWGDGVYESKSEQWDDGNLLSNDGWSQNWFIEAGFGWTTNSLNNPASIWHETWGDGKRFGSTGWDDGNKVDGDGWSSTWIVESGFSWSGGSSTNPDKWFEFCGDGKNISNDSSIWDDGNNNDGDGCSSVWKVEAGYKWSHTITTPDIWNEIWGDGIKFNTLNSYCDDGNNKSDDGCSSKCSIESGYKWSGGSSVSKDVWSISITTQEAAAATATQSTVAVGASISSGASLLSMSSPIGVFASVNQFQLLLLIQFITIVYLIIKL